MEKSDRIPDSMHSKFASITSKTDAFCQRYLNDEYRQLVRTAVAALCRKRPTPLLRGSEDFWAGGFIQGGYELSTGRRLPEDCMCSTFLLAVGWYLRFSLSYRDVEE